MQETISFGTWLRQKRRSLDLTQKAFADQVGCAEITVRRMEADEYKPSKELAYTLFEKLGVPETERHQWIQFARGMSNLPTQAIPLRSRPKSNLPAPLTSFIGREKEQVDVIKLISKHRLVTLTGSGGVGKTRFAIKVGEQLLENYPDGVWLIELASLNDSTLLPQAVARMFGLLTQPDLLHIDLLINFLRGKTALLILDNCEHLIDACALLADTLLKSCPQLKILVTSREPFEIAGEARYRVPSLKLPDHPYRVDDLRDFESVRLFEERAQLIQFDFSITQENAAFIVQICRRLDGIPLAIELAAAKVDVLSPAQISNQLNENMNSLAAAARTAIPRHQTLRASMNWSWNLLTEAEQKLMRQLSVFAGGWTLEAAQFICDDDVKDLLNSLVKKSLVLITHRTENNVRFSFHEIILQYAREKLEESSERTVIRGRHLDFFHGFALRFKQEVHGPEALNWVKQVNVEHDNLREAINWAGDSGQILAGLRLGTALHYYWLGYGYWKLGRETLERLLTCPEAAEHTIIRADALNLAADLATQQGDLDAARALLEESRIIGLELGEAGKSSLGWASMLIGQTWMGQAPEKAKYELEQSFILLTGSAERWRLAIAFLLRGWLAGNQGDLVEARKWFAQSLAILEDMGDNWTAAQPTSALGWAFYCLEDYKAASYYSQQALKVFNAAGDKYDMPGPLARLGSIAVIEGDPKQASAYFNERLEIARELMSRERLASALCDLGIAVGHAGDIAQATVLLHESLEASQAMGNTYLIAICLIGLAGIQQRPRSAVRMLFAAQAILERSSEFLEPLYRLERERVETLIRTALNPRETVRSLEDRHTMTVEQLVKYALEEN